MTWSSSFSAIISTISGLNPSVLRAARRTALPRSSLAFLLNCYHGRGACPGLCVVGNLIEKQLNIMRSLENGETHRGYFQCQRRLFVSFGRLNFISWNKLFPFRGRAKPDWLVTDALLSGDPRNNPAEACRKDHMRRDNNFPVFDSHIL